MSVHVCIQVMAHKSVYFSNELTSGTLKTVHCVAWKAHDWNLFSPLSTTLSEGEQNT